MNDITQWYIVNLNALAKLGRDFMIFTLHVPSARWTSFILLLMVFWRICHPHLIRGNPVPWLVKFFFLFQLFVMHTKHACFLSPCVFSYGPTVKLTSDSGRLLIWRLQLWMSTDKWQCNSKKHFIKPYWLKHLIAAPTAGWHHMDDQFNSHIALE